jgi:hypothetical protein
LLVVAQDAEGVDHQLPGRFASILAIAFDQLQADLEGFLKFLACRQGLGQLKLALQVLSIRLSFAPDLIQVTGGMFLQLQFRLDPFALGFQETTLCESSQFSLAFFIATLGMQQFDKCNTSLIRSSVVQDLAYLLLGSVRI